MNEWFNHFIPLIQLISGVNFAFIITSFHERIYENTFDESKMREKDMSPLNQEITLDADSVKIMKPEDAPDNQSKSETVILKGEYQELVKEWTEKESFIDKHILHLKSSNGSKSLFLFASLYCLVCMFNIAMTYSNPNSFWKILLLMFNLWSAVYMGKITLKIIRNQWADREKEFCYMRTARYFVFSTGISVLCATAIKLCAQNIEYTLTGDAALLILQIACIALPFYPCLFSACYVLVGVKTMPRIVTPQITEIKNRQKALHRRKVALDAIFGTLPGTITFKTTQAKTNAVTNG